jgi:choline dehydrogenase-like flavoprotein
MLGCRCGAKWSAGDFVDQALAAGAQLRTHAYVQRVLRSGRQVIGVEGWLAGEPFVAHAPLVVVAAGGIGTPRILQASGFAQAGAGLTVDATLMVYGVTQEAGIGNEPPMTWRWHNHAEGYMLSTLIDPWLMYPLAAAQVGLPHLATWPAWARVLGVMIKITDDRVGHVAAHTISKPLTAADTERIVQAEQVARRILREAGADPASMFATPLRGTHPGSTAPIGVVVDTDLQTELDGLFVCDASVFPAALGGPTVLTIIGLAKRLAQHLLAP